MIKKSNQQMMLIDFDWTGRENEDCYPPFMNHIQVDWPEGVEDDKPLKKEHDLIWLERNFTRRKNGRHSHKSAIIFML